MVYDRRFGFTGYQDQGPRRPTLFQRPDGSTLPLGGGLARGIRSALSSPPPISQQQAQAAGAAANRAANAAGPAPPTPQQQGQAAGAAANAASRRPNFTPQEQAALRVRGAMPPGGAPSPQAPPMSQQGAMQSGDRAAVQAAAGGPPQSPAQPQAQPTPAQAQAQEVLGPLMNQDNSDLEPFGPSQTTAPINPQDYRAEVIDGNRVLVRNGADLANPGPNDVMSFQNGRWGGSDEQVNDALRRYYGI